MARLLVRTKALIKGAFSFLVHSDIIKYPRQCLQLMSGAYMSNKLGRPTKYKKEFCIQAEKLCRKGFTDKELADFFEVEEKTINNWKKEHPDFLQSLKSGKRHSDAKVEDALYNRALGYEYEEHKYEESEQGIKKTVTKKQLAGDTTAQIFWLKNRQPEKWRDKTETAITLSDDFDSLMGDASSDE